MHAKSRACLCFTALARGAAPPGGVSRRLVFLLVVGLLAGLSIALLASAPVQAELADRAGEAAPVAASPFHLVHHSVLLHGAAAADVRALAARSYVAQILANRIYPLELARSF